MRHLKLSFFIKHCKTIFTVLLTFFIPSLIISTIMVVNAPNDYLQGIYAKIMYIHIPSAHLGLGLYMFLGISSLLFLIYRNTSYDLICKTVAPIGMVYTLITLITGSIWGKPTWGTWWVWDARLTSMLILLLIFIAYLSLRKSFHEQEENEARIAAAFAVFGLINIPIIKFSVYLWNTLHQTSSIFRFEGPSIHESMLYPLMSSAISFVIFTCLLLIINLNTQVLKRKLLRL